MKTVPDWYAALTEGRDRCTAGRQDAILLVTHPKYFVPGSHLAAMDYCQTDSIEEAAEYLLKFEEFELDQMYVVDRLARDQILPGDPIFEEIKSRYTYLKGLKT